jgi:hypothetical protein
MAKSKFTVNLGNLNLSDKQLKKLMDAVHKTVNAELNAATTPVKKSSPVSRLAAGATFSATITATFTNVEPGLSQLNAKHKGKPQSLNQSGTLTFDNVANGDTIRIQGKSLGNSVITIDVEADPPQKKFEPGTFNFNFIIL